MATATAPDIQRYQSLIPYLQGTAAEPRLKLDLFPWGTRQSALSYPFAVIDDSDPVSRLLEARFVTDGGFTLKKVLLQLQKDRYSLPPGGSGSPGNGDVDTSWREASLQEGQEGGGREVVPLLRDQDGAPLPLAPLFYCREKGRFFPPLCPSCGLPLTLCTDEPLLERFGLAPYRTSLKRYLHCGSCSRHGLPEFYRYETDPDDPVTVKDRWTLMERFRQIDSCMDPDAELPCVGCAGRDACFGAEHEARRRMVPFSFYPFHLLITELPTLYGSDFLHLISGAEPGELAERLDPQRAPGREALLRELARSRRGRGTLYTPGEERFFPEVLFLKLTLLSDALRLLDPAAFSFGLDRVVVHLPQVSGELPAFWNYSAALLPDVTPASYSQSSFSVPSASVAHLAIFWIELLCRNSEVGAQEIHAAVTLWLGEGKGAEPVRRGVAEILRAGNLCWQPARQVAGEKWLPFWERACAPARRLLTAARDRAPAPSLTAILEEIGELRGELKRALLSAGDPQAEAARGSSASPPEHRAHVQAGAAPPAAAVDNRAVRAVLEKLKERARSELREGAAPLAAASQAQSKPLFDDDETMETVILTPGPSRPRGAPILPPVDVCETWLPGQPPAAAPEASRDEVLETVDAPGSRLPASRPAFPSPPAPLPQAGEGSVGAVGEGVVGTVMAPGSRLQAPPPSPSGERNGARRSEVASPAAASPPSSPGGSEPDQLTETIFVRPPGDGRPGGRLT